MATTLALAFSLVFQLALGAATVILWRQLRTREAAFHAHFKSHSKFWFKFLYYFLPVMAFFIGVKVLSIIKLLLDPALSG